MNIWMREGEGLWWNVMFGRGTRECWCQLVDMVEITSPLALPRTASDEKSSVWLPLATWHRTRSPTLRPGPRVQPSLAAAASSTDTRPSPTTANTPGPGSCWYGGCMTNSDLKSSRYVYCVPGHILLYYHWARGRGIPAPVTPRRVTTKVGNTSMKTWDINQTPKHPWGTDISVFGNLAIFFSNVKTLFSHQNNTYIWREHKWAQIWVKVLPLWRRTPQLFPLCTMPHPLNPSSKNNLAQPSRINNSWCNIWNSQGLKWVMLMLATPLSVEGMMQNENCDVAWANEEGGGRQCMGRQAHHRTHAAWASTEQQKLPAAILVRRHAPRNVSKYGGYFSEYPCHQEQEPFQERGFYLSVAVVPHKTQPWKTTESDLREIFHTNVMQSLKYWKHEHFHLNVSIIVNGSVCSVVYLVPVGKTTNCIQTLKQKYQLWNDLNILY